MAASISVVIITYNRPEDTLALLESIQSQDALLDHVGEVLLLNNASSASYADVVTFIENHREIPITYISHPENLGVARGRNLLIQQAQYPILLLLDDDMVFAKSDAVVQMASLFSKQEFISNNTAVITLSIFYYETRERQQNALPHKQYQAYKDKEWFLTYYFAGGGHLIKKEVFEQTGLYPEDFFYGMEEYDLSYRIIDAGYSLAYDHTVVLLHKESPHGRAPNRDKLAMMWYNKCVVAWRYLPNQYFYSTAFMWAFAYLKRTKGDFSGAWRNLKRIGQIPQTVATRKIGEEALRYLRRVGARLWY